MGGWQTSLRREADFKLAQAIKNGASSKTVGILQAEADAARAVEQGAKG